MGKKPVEFDIIGLSYWLIYFGDFMDIKLSVNAPTGKWLLFIGSFDRSELNFFQVHPVSDMSLFPQSTSNTASWLHWTERVCPFFKL